MGGKQNVIKLYVLHLNEKYGYVVSHSALFISYIYKLNLYNGTIPLLFLDAEAHWAKH